MKKNRLFSLILLVTMFFSLYTQSEVAAEDSVAAFDVVTFEYCDGSNNPITDFNNFTPGQVIKAKANIKNIGNASGATTLMLMAYQSGKLIQFDSDKITLAAGADDDFMAQITLPADPTGCTVQTYFWSDLISMDAVSNPAEFGSDNAEVLSMSICGVDVEFDDERNADIVLPFKFSGTITEDDIDIDFNDLSASFTFTHDSDNKVITITTKSSSGNTSETFIVNYTVALPRTDVTYYYAGSPTESTVAYDLTKREVVKKPVDALTSNADKTVWEALGMEETSISDSTVLTDYATSAWADRPGSIFWNIPDELLGWNYALCRAFTDSNPNGVSGDSSNNMASANWTTMDITIEQNTTILYSARVNSRSGVTCTSDPNVSVSSLPIELSSDLTYLDLNYSSAKTTTIASANKRTFGDTLYLAFLTVPDGQESATYRVNTTCQLWYPTMLLYKKTESSDRNFIPFAVTGSTITDGTNTASYPIWGHKIMLPQFVQDTNEGSTTKDRYFIGNENTLTYDSSTNTTTTIEGVWGVHATRLNAYVYDYFVSVPDDDMLGADIFSWGTTQSGITSTDALAATFTINRDATIWFDAPDDFITSSGAQALDGGFFTANAGNFGAAVKTYSVEDPNALTGTAHHSGRLYKLVLEVPEGQETKTFTIPLRFDNGTRPFLFIKKK